MMRRPPVDGAAGQLFTSALHVIARFDRFNGTVAPVQLVFGISHAGEKQNVSFKANRAV
jgi:hypothetical protein